MTSTNISQHFVAYINNKLSDTINDFSDEIARLYQVDPNKIIEIWNKICPEIELKKKKDLGSFKKEKVPQKDPDSFKKEECEIVGPDSNKVYTADDVFDEIVKLLRNKIISTKNLESDIENYKLIKKQLKKKEFEVSKSVIKKIVNKNKAKIIDYSSKVPIEDVEEFNPED